MNFQGKIKANRKKNLSSKIIVDQYDHLIRNSKIQPNYQSFTQTPISQHFNPLASKYSPSYQQSSQSQYSLHQKKQKPHQKQCYKCGQNFSPRIYQSHIKVCQDNILNHKRLTETINFTKKDDYKLSSLGNIIDSGVKLINKRSKNHNLAQQKQKMQQLKKQTSKKSLHSKQKIQLKRPSSSTRNKVELKGHDNLKQKILNKLQSTRRKNVDPTQNQKRVSSSVKRNITSNSKIKQPIRYINKHQYGNQFNTINSQSLKNNKRLQNKDNVSFNRSEIINQQRINKEKQDFLSKINIKQDKKNTLKKKNINFNNSLVYNHVSQRDKNKSKNQIQKNNHQPSNYNFTQNNSLLTKNNSYGKKQQIKSKQIIRQQLRKQGVFRRDSSSSASKRKFNKQSMKKKLQQKTDFRENQVNEQYYYFDNNIESAPRHMRRQQHFLMKNDKFQRNGLKQSNRGSNMIRNKLGINKNLLQSKQQKMNIPLNKNFKYSTIQNQFQDDTYQNQKIFTRNQINQNQFQHRRANSNRQNYIKNNQLYQNVFHGLKQKSQQENYIYSKPEIKQQINFNQRNKHNQRQRPENPMGQQRQTFQRKQTQNRIQNNRPQPRITNQRMNSQNQNQSLNNRNQQPESRNNPRPLQNNRENHRQNNERRRQQTQNRRQQIPNRRSQNQRARPQNPRRQNRDQNQNRRRNQQQRRRNQNTNQQNRQGQQIRHQTLNFISNTLNQQFQVMNEHFNLLNNIFSNFNNYVNINVTTSNQQQNPTTFIFRSRRRNNRRRNNNHQNQNDSSGESHSEYSDYSSDFSQDDSFDNDTDYSEEQYYYEGQEEQNPGMTEHQINSIPVIKYNKNKHGSNQCTICLVELNQNQLFKKLFCEHVFHQQCIDEWLKRKNACPVCRDQMGVRS